MAKKRELDRPLRKGDRVVVTVDIPGAPEGTQGKVKLVNGLGSRTWQRYWVFFDNGAQLGSIGADKLVRAEGWEQFKLDRAAAAEAAASAAAAPPKPVAVEPAAEEKPAGAKSKVPAHLLERAKKAREKAAAGGG
ncbi:MAG: hypothetical protein ACKVWR_19980 [Acidimicrobiales bacterium]